MARPPEHQAVKRVWESQLSAAGAALFNNAINSDAKKLRRSFLTMQLFGSGYGWR